MGQAARFVPFRLYVVDGRWPQPTRRLLRRFSVAYTGSGSFTAGGFTGSFTGKVLSGGSIGSGLSGSPSGGATGGTGGVVGVGISASFHLCFTALLLLSVSD